MTKEFDAYCDYVMASVKRDTPLAGDPADLVKPDMEKVKATANVPTKTERSEEADCHTTTEADPKPAAGGKDCSGLVKGKVKGGEPVDRVEFQKNKKAETGTPIAGKGQKAEVATSYKSGRLVAIPSAPTNK